MKRTLMVAGVLAVVVLALLILACGSDATPTSVPATPAPPAPTTAVVSATEAPTEVPTAAPTTAVPESTPEPSPTTAPAPTPTAAAPTAAPAPTATPATPAPTTAPTPEGPEEVDLSDAYFSMDRVLEVSIEIAAEDWDTLRHQTRTFEDLMAEIEEYNLSRPFADIYTWFSATVTIDGETHTEVGVRKKGFLGSQSDTKPSLKLRYDKYVDGQSLGGVMERMTLNNSVQDPSMVNTCLAYQVFAAAGPPSPRCNFATVAVNGKNLGLYVHVEELKKPFLARHFDSAEGNLYEGTVSDFIPSHRGTFEKKTNEDEGDWSDVNAVMAALQNPSDAGLVALSKIVDLDRFLSFWATEVLVGHWDGYTGDRNNYHFYREPDGKFVFIPWGVDDTFHLKDDPNPFDNISNPPPSVLAFAAIPNRLYNTPEWRGKYAERLKEVLEEAWDEDTLLASVDAMAAIVAEHALPDAKSEAAKNTERVRKFILKRKGELLADLTPEPPDWPEPEEGTGAGGQDMDPSAFEVHFETTWGSNANPNPLEEGRVTYLLSEDGVQTGDALTWMGVTAGAASPEEQLVLPGVADTASITIMGLVEGSGEIEGVTLVLPRDMLTDGTVLTLGEDLIGGVAWGIAAGAALPEWFEPLTGGRLELTMAGTGRNAVISGRFSGSTGAVAESLPGPLGKSIFFDVEFETTWGSNSSANHLEEGRARYLSKEDGAPTWDAIEWRGAMAGPASPEEQALVPGLPDMASITIMGFLAESGSIEGATIVLPREMLADGVVLMLGVDPIGGGVWGIPAGATAPEWFEPLTWARLKLVATGTEPGDIISGRFSGRAGEDPGTAPEAIEAGTVEVEFETAWGSKDSADPFSAGGQVSHLAVNGEDVGGLAVAATAGSASPEEQAILPTVPNPASITVLSLQRDGSLTGLTIVVDADALVLDTTDVEPGTLFVINVDEYALAGGLWTIPPGASEPDSFTPFTTGRLELVASGTEPGDIISGRFVGSTGENTGPAREAIETGPVEIRFEAKWKSKLSANPLMEGKVYELNESGEWVLASQGEAGATAGPASPEEAAEIGVANAAMITVMGLYPDLTVQGFTVWMPIDRVVPGAKLVIGEDTGVGAAIWRIPAGKFEPEGFIPITTGGIDLTEGGTESGAIISGLLHFRIGPAELAALEGEAPAAAPVDTSGLSINEVAAKGDPLDWFELYNASDAAIALANLVVADDLKGTGKRVAFPAGTSIGPGEYLQVEVDSDNWAGFKLGGDEELGIWTSEGVLVDSVDWDEGDSPEGESYARLPDGTGEFHTVVPTPGEENEHHH